MLIAIAALLTSQALPAPPLELPIPLTAAGIEAFLDGPGGSKVKDVGDFLALLPEELRSNPVVMIESASTQGATPENPRIILKGPGATTLIAFNTGRNQPGFKTIELTLWDEEASKFRFSEIVFAKGKKTFIHTDDTQCKRCHGDDPRVNWDSYNFWPGQLPFNQDRLTGPWEKKTYKKLLKRARSDPRLKHVKFAPIGEPEEEFDVEIGMRVGNGIDLFDESADLNFQRIAKGLKDQPGYDRWRYAALAAVDRCPNLESFIPEELRAEHEKRLGGMSLQALRDETAGRQESIFEHKLKRQRDLFARLLCKKPRYEDCGPKGKRKVDRELGTPEKRDEEDDFMGAMRYFLEPFGVKVAQWSTSLDANFPAMQPGGQTYPATYSFGDKLGEIPPVLKNELSSVYRELDPLLQARLEQAEKDYYQEVKWQKDNPYGPDKKRVQARSDRMQKLQAIQEENKCESLKAFSLRAFRSRGLAPAPPCPEADLRCMSVLRDQTTFKRLSQKLSELAFLDKCISCHGGKAPISNLAFVSAEKLARSIVANPALSTEMLRRSNPTSRPHDPMPPTGKPGLTPKEFSAFEAYLKSVVDLRRDGCP